MKEYSDFKGINKDEYDKSREIIGAHLSELRLLEIGNPVDGQKNAVFNPEYTGGVIKSEAEGVITLIAYLPKIMEFIYRANDKVTLAYPGDGRLHIFPAHIIDAREANAEDLAKVNKLFRTRFDNLGKILGPIKFVTVDACALDEPQLHQRRQYPRSKVKWDVYFKFAEPDEELEKAQKEWLSGKLFECDRGYLKIKTVDVSAGGFKSEIRAQIPDGTHIECVIEIKAGKFKAVGRIASRVISCLPNDSKPDTYDMRVQFLDLDESAKSAMADGELHH